MSKATGVLFFAAFFGIATGPNQGGATLTFVVLAFTAAVELGWAWVSVLAARLNLAPALAAGASAGVAELAEAKG